MLYEGKLSVQIFPFSEKKNNNNTCLRCNNFMLQFYAKCSTFVCKRTMSVYNRVKIIMNCCYRSF